MPAQVSLPQLPVPEPPAALLVPRLRFWGDRKPPKNRADMFSCTVRAAAEGETSTAGGSSTGEKVATLRIYGPIDSWGGWWGISAADVSAALDGLDADVDEVRVRINSPGGEVWEGMAILNMLRAHRARVVAVVDGVAASAASVIATGVDETVMSPGTQMMIHDASGFAWGPAAVMRKAASFLDSCSNAIASVYAESAGGTDEQWRALMVDEIWYTAKEAVAAKLADRVEVVPDAGDTSTAGDPNEPGAGDPVEDRFDLSIFNYAGRSHAPAPKTPAASATGTTPPAAPAPGDPTMEGDAAVADITDEQLTTLRQAVGVDEDADVATCLEALTEALNERADDTGSDQENAIPDGHVVIPEARLSDLEDAAAQGVQAATQLRQQGRDAFLDSVRAKFAPSNRKAWEKEYDRDPNGTRAHFASAPDIVPLDELGHGDNPDAVTSQQDSLMASVGWGEPTTKEA